MRKVLYVIDSLQTGGAERSLLDIASRLQVCQPVVCHIYRNDFLKAEFEKQGIRVISLGVQGPYGFREAIAKLSQVMVNEQPDLVVGTLLRSELISRWVCRRLKIPNVGTFVNDTYSRFELRAQTWAMRIKIGFFWILNAITARWCVAFLSNSQYIRVSNCRALGVPPEKVQVIYRGRKPEIFHFKERTDMNQSAPKLLAIGRLLYRKGFSELIKAFFLYRREFPQAVLSIAGEGPYRLEIEKLLSDLDLKGAVHLLGTRTDVVALMHEHDIFVLPSHYEGFSGTLVEAMLAGIPIVASDIPMNKEAVEHGISARLFKVQDIGHLALELITATRQTAETLRFARQARSVAETQFSIDRIAQQHDAFYQSIGKSLTS